MLTKIVKSDCLAFNYGYQTWHGDDLPESLDGQAFHTVQTSKER